jgi:hypothetical protein
VSLRVEAGSKRASSLPVAACCCKARLLVWVVCMLCPAFRLSSYGALYCCSSLSGFLLELLLPMLRLGFVQTTCGPVHLPIPPRGRCMWRLESHPVACRECAVEFVWPSWACRCSELRL